MKKSLKFVLGMLIVVAMIVPCMNIKAAEMPTITMNVEGDFYVGKSQEFSITTNAPAEYEGIMVVGKGGISDPSAIEKLEYYEVKDGNWYEMPTDGNFGPAVGFPLTNGATSKFRVTFNKVGEYSINFEVAKVDTDETVAKNTLTIKVNDPSIKDVTNEEELLAAVKDSQIKTINIVNDITTTQKVNVTRDVTINGNSHKITLNVGDNTVWGGHYVLQAYKANVTINDIALTGGNAALLVNGSNVVLNGKIDVSGNGFGGIELANAAGVTPSINLENANLVNTTEAYLLPTLWTDPVMEDVEVNYSGFAGNIIVDKGDHEQTQYYLEKKNTLDSADNQIKEQINESTININTTSDDVISVEVLNQLKNGPEKEIIIGTENAVITFNTKNMVEEFTSDLKLNVIITKEQPFESNVLDNVDSKLLFIDLEYDGVLAKDTKIIFSTMDMYNVGDKVYLYYYNEETGKVELIAKDIEIKEDGLAAISIDHASTYFLSSNEIADSELTENTDNTEDIQNPNTSDFTIVIVAGLIVLSVAGFAYVAKVKMANK